MQLRLGIVEDNLLMAKSIYLIAKQLGYTPIDPVGSYNTGLTMIELEKPDLVIVDIQLNGEKDGIDLAMKIKEDNRIPYIFLTADTGIETLDRVKRMNPPAYLIKPVTKESLFAAIEICVHKFYHKNQMQISAKTNKDEKIINNSIFIRVEQSIQKIDIAEILYLESNNNYLTLYTTDSSFQLRNSLHGFIRSANSSKFVRIHKKYVINLDKITKITSESLDLPSITLPLSKAYRDSLLSQLNIM